MCGSTVPFHEPNFSVYPFSFSELINFERCACACLHMTPTVAANPD